MSDPYQYQMRGSRVKPWSASEIEMAARGFYDVVKPKGKRRIKRFDSLLEKLARYGITISVIDDDDWLEMTHGLTVGHFEPSDMTISIPDGVYTLACHGDYNSLSVMFHELGHLLLGHRPQLHFSLIPPVQEEDSEWQADQFAEAMLRCFGYNVEQLSFFEFWE